MIVDSRDGSSGHRFMYETGIVEAGGQSWSTIEVHNGLVDNIGLMFGRHWKWNELKIVRSRLQSGGTIQVDSLSCFDEMRET